jgi:hypothetical protein
MSKPRATLALAIVAVSCGIFSTASFAQAQSMTEGICPAKYWLMGTLCLNNDTGDVVLVSTPATDRISPAGCRPGYWRQDALCFSASSGDVELVDEQSRPADQRAEVAPGAPSLPPSPSHR